MKTNENAAGIHPRMLRIRKVVRLVRFLISASVILLSFGASLVLADLLGFHFLPTGWALDVSPGMSYRSPFNIAPLIIAYGVLRMGLIYAGTLTIFWWLELVETGDCFNSQSVRFIKRLAWLVVIDWFVQRVFEVTHGQILLQWNELVTGLLVLLFAWIMDEGSKLKEEQELTV